jgi:hypothetical protein
MLMEILGGVLWRKVQWHTHIDSFLAFHEHLAGYIYISFVSDVIAGPPTVLSLAAAAAALYLSGHASTEAAVTTTNSSVELRLPWLGRRFEPPIVVAFILALLMFGPVGHDVLQKNGIEQAVKPVTMSRR